MASIPPRNRADGPLVHHDGAVTRVRISPDGRVLASGGSDGRVQLADLELGRASFTVPVEGPVADLDAGASLVVAAVGWDVVLVGTHAGRELRRLAAGGPVRSVALARDGAQVAAVVGEGEVVVWRAVTGRVVARHAIPGARVLAWAGRTGELRVADASGQVLALEARGGGSRCLAQVEPPVHRVAVAHHERRGVASTWTVAAGRVVTDAGAVEEVEDGVLDLDLLGDRPAVALGAGGWTAGATRGAEHAVAIAWHPGGDRVAVATAGGEIVLRPVTR